MVGASREVGDGVAIDATGQHIGEASYWQDDGETVDVVDDKPIGEVQTVALSDGSGDS